MKKISCTDLQSSIYFAPDELRHCCTRFFRKGELQGDVRIFSIESDQDISKKSIINAKRKLVNDINDGKLTPCTGCPKLKKAVWKELEEEKINHISIESHSICNMKCTYCSETYYGGQKSNYDLDLTLEKLHGANFIAPFMSMVWGGGEAVLLEKFDHLFDKYSKIFKPFNNRVYTNSTIYSKPIEEQLKEGKCTIITSMDAGTEETFQAVRKSKLFKRVLKNLEKYAEVNSAQVTIKYIFLPENASQHEVYSFVKEVEKHSLQNCNFQLSYDFKEEHLNEDIVKGISLMYEALRKAGCHFINLDDHIRRRISDELNAGKTPELDKPVIVWGTGNYATYAIKNSKFFKENKIDFFVDSHIDKKASQIEGIEVKNPESITENENPIFIGSASFYREIYDTIVSMGVSPDRIVDHLLV